MLWTVTLITLSTEIWDSRLHKSLEERGSHLHRGGSLKLRTEFLTEQAAQH